MRILFMGTPDIAAECLKALYAAGHEICGVYTRRDKPVGRKQVLTAPPVKEVALEHGTPVFQPRTLRDEAVQAAAKLVGLHGTIVSLDDGYDTLCKPEIFSQGQWQLLSIARAVAGEPKILLLDEITANLDAETEEMVLRALKSASEGRTVISISHRVYQKDGTGRLITVYG